MKVRLNEIYHLISIDTRIDSGEVKIRMIRKESRCQVFGDFVEEIRGNVCWVLKLDGRLAGKL